MAIVSKRAILQQRMTNVPPPRIVPISQYYDGCDGPWSSFAVRVGGNQPQLLRLLPSTSLSATFAIGIDGCKGAEALGSGFNCAESRGGTFDKDRSTFDYLNTYNMGGYQTFSTYGAGSLTAAYGRDKVSLGYKEDHGPLVNSSLVAVIIDLNYTWTGLLGINSKAEYFADTTGFSAPHSGLLDILRNASEIPSMSFGYTAGSYWRKPSVPGSLVLGGYDAAIRGDDGIELAMGPDVEAPFTLAIQDLAVRGSDFSQSFGAVSSAIIDSNRPYIRLFKPVCDRIQQLLNLTWDSTSQHYLISNATNDKLSTLGLNLDFRISQNTSANKSILISLPFESLVLKLGYPRVALGNESWYFPMLPVYDRNQVTLGRAFLQNSYLTANFEDRVFSINQVKWPTGSPSSPQLHPIYNTTFLAGRHDGGVARPSKAQVAGLVVGIASLVLVVLLSLIFYRRSRRRKAEALRKKLELEEAEAAAKVQSPDSTQSPGMTLGTSHFEIDSTPMQEADSTTVEPTQDSSGTEMPDSTGSFSHFYRGAELDSSVEKQIYELPGSTVMGADARSAGPPRTGTTNLMHGPDAAAAAAIPASPIPQTPLEFYGRAAGRSSDRGWVARAPELPNVTFTPATPLSPTLRVNPFRSNGLDRVPEVEGQPPPLVQRRSSISKD